MSDEAIEVRKSPLVDQLWALLRQVVPPTVTFLIGRHWIPDDVASLLLAIFAGVAVPIAMGQAKTRKQSQQLSDIAASPDVPDSVVKLKS